MVVEIDDVSWLVGLLMANLPDFVDQPLDNGHNQLFCEFNQLLNLMWDELAEPPTATDEEGILPVGDAYDLCKVILEGIPLSVRDHVNLVNVTRIELLDLVGRVKLYIEPASVRRM